MLLVVPSILATTSAMWLLPIGYVLKCCGSTFIRTAYYLGHSSQTRGFCGFNCSVDHNLFCWMWLDSVIVQQIVAHGRPLEQELCVSRTIVRALNSLNNVLIGNDSGIGDETEDDVSMEFCSISCPKFVAQRKRHNWLLHPDESKSSSKFLESVIFGHGKRQQEKRMEPIEEDMILQHD
jgi:hypothetical protein